MKVYKHGRDYARYASSPRGSGPLTGLESAVSGNFLFTESNYVLFSISFLSDGERQCRTDEAFTSATSPTPLCSLVWFCEFRLNSRFERRCEDGFRDWLQLSILWRNGFACHHSG